MEFELQGVERIPAYAGMNGASFPFSESITETIEETGPYNVFVTKIVDLHDPFRALNSEIIFTANQYIGSLSLYFNKKRFSVHPPNFLNKVGKGRYDIIPQSNVLRVLEEGVPMYRIGLDFKSGIIDINFGDHGTQARYFSDTEKFVEDVTTVKNHLEFIIGVLMQHVKNPSHHQNSSRKYLLTFVPELPNDQY